MGNVRKSGGTYRDGHYRDRAGQQFGDLLAIRDTGERRNREAVWECRCLRCDSLVLVPGCALRQRRRASRSRGCALCPRRNRLTGRPRGRPARDFAGLEFGLLTAVRATEERRHGCVVWLCVCVPERGGCGAEVAVRSDLLRKMRSCGSPACRSANRRRSALVGA